jgi:hypothetical protein
LGKLKKVDKSLIKDASAPRVPGKEAAAAPASPAGSATPGAKGSPAARPGPMSMQEEMAAKLARKKAQQ